MVNLLEKVNSPRTTSLETVEPHWRRSGVFIV